MQLLIEAIGFGIAAGAVIALGAVGFSLQFGISNILNITYGSLMTLAAYIGLFLIDRGVNPWVTLGIAGVVVGVVSVAFQRWLLAPLARRVCSRGRSGRKMCSLCSRRRRWPGVKITDSHSSSMNVPHSMRRATSRCGIMNPGLQSSETAPAPALPAT